MKNRINSVNMNEQLDHEEIYNLYKTHSPVANKKITEKINIFKYNKDFLEFYSSKDIKNLLDILELKLSESNDESFLLFKSDIDQYISCITEIILSIKLFLKIQDILTKIFISAKNNLSKLKDEYKLENYNQDYLFLYLELLLKISDRNLKLYSSSSTELSSNISSFEDTPSNFFQKFSNEYKIESFSRTEAEPIIYDVPSTPRFESDADKMLKNFNLEDTIENNTSIKKESVLTLSQYVFAEEPASPKNNGVKLNNSPVVKSNRKLTSIEERVDSTENVNKTKIKKSITFDPEPTNKIKQKNHYKNLLEMINKIYKKELINSDEKVKLKKLIIEKSQKIENLYYNIYKNSKNDENTLVNEIKKIIKS